MRYKYNIKTEELWHTYYNYKRIQLLKRGPKKKIIF